MRPFILAIILSLCPFAALHAASIAGPNFSFESPETDFADPRMDGWQESPQPQGYDDHGGFFPWYQVVGQFHNPTNGAPNHIDNMDGNQGAYLFALPGVAVFQDYNTSPTHDFNTRFEAGKSYALTVGVLGGGGGMSNGATFQISLYYRNAASNQVTVAATTVTNHPGLFPTNTHFADFQVRVPLVKPADPWAGKNIGIQLASTIIDTNLSAGYWDVDNVRLQVVSDPVLSGFTVNTNHQFQFSLSSALGRYEILTTTNLASPLSSWISLAITTNFTGAVSITDTNMGRRFYRARTSP